ncbi:hypothetical protein V6Z11_D02G080800 [Gossypium hirsutum]
MESEMIIFQFWGQRPLNPLPWHHPPPTTP